MIFHLPSLNNVKFAFVFLYVSDYALDRNNFKYNARETVILVGTTIFWWPVLFQRRRYE